VYSVWSGMPELPEVETVMRGPQARLEGRACRNSPKWRR